MGGCCNSHFNIKTDNEILVDEIFSKFPIRNISSDFILAHLDKKSSLNSIYKKVLSKENFEKICNKYCKYSQNINSLDSYWQNFYITKPLEFRFIFIKIQMAFLGKQSSDTKNSIDLLINCLIEYKTYFSLNKLTCNIDDITIPFKILYSLIYNYIFSITYLTIEYLKEFDKDSYNFKKILEEKWEIKILEAYVICAFFEEERDVDQEININYFITKNHLRLTDDCCIRSEINDFYYLYQNLPEKNKLKFMKTVNLINLN